MSARRELVAAFMREHRTLKTPGHARSLMYIESFAPKTPLNPDSLTRA